jgi:hypothetical protein
MAYGGGLFASCVVGNATTSSFSVHAEQQPELEPALEW